jgi:signal transduction histidine kinase
MMPEMDGYEVCEQLKKNDNTKDIPVIFLTGKAETEDIIKGFRLGAVDYVTKPFNSVELLSRVRTHIELKLSKDFLMEYNQQLTEAEKELRQLNASKDKFFSIVAHDMRGPFSGFLGLTELLSVEYDNLDKDEIMQIGDSMNKAAKRLFSFLENLLEWSRSQMGRMDYTPLKFDLFGVVDKIVKLMSATANKKKINIIQEIDRNTYVYADNNMLNTVMRNLVSNALKFTKEGGHITISAKDIDDDRVMISVADTGIGMKEEAKSKIFRIETKYSTPGTNNEQGTGLGLILCKELVEKNDGEIFVESELGKGTTFSFTLPKNEPK